MNALELAEFYEPQSSQAATMLRKQDAAIKQLREALIYASTYIQEDEAERGRPFLTGQVVRSALAATEEFAK